MKTFNLKPSQILGHHATSHGHCLIINKKDLPQAEIDDEITLDCLDRYGWYAIESLEHTDKPLISTLVSFQPNHGVKVEAGRLVEYEEGFN